MFSNKKIYFNCTKCKIPFNITLSNVTINNSWCQKCCESKGEVIISNIIRKLNYKDNSQKKFKGCKNKNLLSFDNGIINELPLNILIEFDGEQHFYVIEFFKGLYGFIDRIKRDLIKNRYILDNNMILVRISYNWINIRLKTNYYIKNMNPELFILTGYIELI